MRNHLLSIYLSFYQLNTILKVFFYFYLSFYFYNYYSFTIKWKLLKENFLKSDKNYFLINLIFKPGLGLRRRTWSYSQFKNRNRPRRPSFISLVKPRPFWRSDNQTSRILSLPPEFDGTKYLYAPPAPRAKSPNDS